MTKTDILFWVGLWALVLSGLWLLDKMARMTFTLQTM